MGTHRKVTIKLNIFFTVSDFISELGREALSTVQF